MNLLLGFLLVIDFLTTLSSILVYYACLIITIRDHNNAVYRQASSVIGLQGVRQSRMHHHGDRYIVDVPPFFFFDEESKYFFHSGRSRKEYRTLTDLLNPLRSRAALTLSTNPQPCTTTHTHKTGLGTYEYYFNCAYN